jgi:hypothetical protein
MRQKQREEGTAAAAVLYKMVLCGPGPFFDVFFAAELEVSFFVGSYAWCVADWFTGKIDSFRFCEKVLPSYKSIK